MSRLWLKFRLPLSIMVLLLATLVMMRLFSGPEDTWTMNESGKWVMHGHPSDPPPAGDYREPLSYKFVPFAFLLTFSIPLFFFGLHKLRNRLTYNGSTRDAKLFGYLSIALFLFGISVGTGLTLEVFLSGTGSPSGSMAGQELLIVALFILFIGGFAGLSILTGVQFYMLKRSCSDHYQLEKTHREILEALEKLPPLSKDY